MTSLTVELAAVTVLLTGYLTMRILRPDWWAGTGEERLDHGTDHRHRPR